MLLALYTIFFLGGGFSFAISDLIDDIEKSTKTVVVNDEQKKAVCFLLCFIGLFIRVIAFNPAMKRTDIHAQVLRCFRQWFV